jgi:DNA-directed RNA polymerase specialized sigma subunit
VLDEAGRLMVAQYAALARSAAWNFWRRTPTTTDLDELKGIAYLALCQAAERYPEYCAEHGYDPATPDYVVAFLIRRVRGALLDWARSEDHVSRGQRKTLKAIEKADLAGASTAELARLAGVSEAGVLAAQAAAVAKPVSIDQAPDGDPDWVLAVLTDPAVGTESVAAVRGMLGATARVFAELPVQQQVIVVRHYLHDDALKDIARDLGITSDLAGELHQAAVLALHAAMLAEADGGGCACGNETGSCACSAP